MANLDDLFSGGEAVEKITGYQSKDPVTAARENFSKVALKVLKSIADGEKASHWHKSLADGKVQVELKNGTSAVALKPGVLIFKFADAEKAKQYIMLAMEAAEKGDMDAEFARTRRRPMKKKSKTGAPKVSELEKAKAILNGAPAH